MESLMEIARNDHLIIMLDANEYQGEEQQGLEVLKHKNGLIDIYHDRHIQDKAHSEFPTHINGSRRIDYILMTEHTSAFVTAIGYTPFYDLFDTDHRSMYCDLDTKMFDEIPRTVVHLERLVGTNSRPKEAKNYIETLNLQFNRHRIFEKSTQLLIEATESPQNNEDRQQRLEQLDELITHLMLKTESETCSAKLNVMWSPEIWTSHRIINYLILKLKAKRSQIDISVQLAVLRTKIPEEYHTILQDTHMGIFSALRAEKKNFQQLVQKHWELRREYLTGLVTNPDGTPKSAAELAEIKVIKSREQMRKNYADLRRVFKPARSAGITSIDIPNDTISSGYECITNPREVEDLLLQRNVKHFSQASDTPFASGLIADHLGYEGNNTTTETIIEGEISKELHSLPPSIQTILDKLSDNGRLPTISSHISFDEYKQALKKWAEKTSTSPSRRHLGHYKVLIHTPPIYLEETNTENSINDRLLFVYYNITMTALLSGSTIKRWCQVTTAMIEKVPGVARIDNLRVIHLYEADYNLILKILWARKLVWNTHNHQSLNDGQSGSRPGRKAIDVVIQKEMKYLYARLTRSMLGTMDNDAKSCYDRIICNLAMLVSRYYGMPLDACKTQATTLKNMVFSLKTAMGVSEQSYQHSHTTPIHGSGQGSCASPCIWLLISSLLMDCLANKAKGMSQQHVTNPNNHVTQWIDGFVDDTSIFSNKFIDNTSVKDLAIQLQEDASIWANLLAASGGKLELDKCFYYLLTWKFDGNGNAKPESLIEQQAKHEQISITDETSKQTITITQKDVNTPHKTLGAMKTLSGCEKAQIQFLMEKSNKFANKLCGAKLNRIQAMLAYRSIYIPSMVYSLSATNLDQASLDKIQSKATDTCLSAAGYEKTFPKAVVYGNKQFGGLGFTHLHTEKCIQQIESLVTHVRADTTLGKSFVTNLQWIQLVSGSSLPIMESTHEIKYMDSNWILDIREFLITTKSTMHIKDIWTPRLYRENDVNLMDSLVSKNLPNNQLRIFNNWRLFFQVTRLSDMTNAAGDKVAPKYVQYTASPLTCQRSTLQWPRQDRPNSKSFNVWKRILQTHFSVEVTGRLSGYSLGTWKVPHHLMDRKWQYIFNFHTSELYEYSDKITKRICVHESRNTRRYNRESTLTAEEIPRSTIPIDVTHHGKFLHSYHSRNTPVHVPEIEESSLSDGSISPDHALTSWIQTQNNWKSKLLEYQTSDAQLFNKTITDVEVPLYIVSDGGLKDDKGGFGTIIGTNQSVIATTKGSTPKSPGMNSSYRTEAYGMLAGLTLIEGLISITKPIFTHPRTVLCYSDNEALVKVINKHRRQQLTVKSYYAPDIDLELEILSMIEELESHNILLIFQHVRGHQDKHTAYANLTRPAQLNVLADELATSTITMPIPEYYDFPSNKVNLMINGTIITSHSTHFLREASLSQKLRAYLTEKYKWSSTIPDLIWWKVHGKAFQALSDKEKIQIHKFIHHRMTTNQREHLYGKRNDNKCPDCDLIETHAHLIQCNHEKRTAIKTDMLKDLQEVSSKNKAPQEMHDAFIAGISAWMNNTPTPNLEEILPNASRQLIQTYREQEKIGWFQVFHGRLAMSWASFINHAIHSEDGNETQYASAETWGTQITLVLWRHILQLWGVRNESEHGADNNEKMAIRKRKLMEIIVGIKESPTVSNTTDQTYINTPLDKLANLTQSHMEAWIWIAKILQKMDKQRKMQESLILKNTQSKTGRRGARSRPHRPSRDIGLGSIRP